MSKRRHWLAVAAGLVFGCQDAPKPHPMEPLPPNKGVTGISISPISASLAPGDTMRFRAVQTMAVPPQDTTITWTISNPNVAVVDSTGFVRAVASGWATVVATARANANFKAGAEITVR